MTRKIVHPDSVPLVNNAGFRHWFNDRKTEGMDAFDGFTRMHFLLKDNREDFAKFFGKKNRTLRGEFFHHVWDIIFEDKHFVIFTAAGKGTGYEYAEPGTDYDSIRDEALAPLFIRFAEHIYAKFDKKDIAKFKRDLQKEIKISEKKSSDKRC
jgi:hypothetical protein